MPPRPDESADARDLRIRQELLDQADPAEADDASADDIFGEGGGGAVPLFTGLYGEIPGSDTRPLRLPRDTRDPEPPASHFVDPLS